MKLLDRLIRGDMHGVHYAVIFVATAILWFLVHKMAQTNPVWAISSMVATSDPAMKQAVLILRSRVVNTLVGCIVGLIFIGDRWTEYVLSATCHGGHGIAQSPVKLEPCMMASVFGFRSASFLRFRAVSGV